MDFAGRERIGFQLAGTVPTSAARDRCGGNVPIDDAGGRAPVRLTVLALEDVGAGAVPVKLTYLEALWRVGLLLRKKPAWLVVKVDVDRALVRGLASWLMSYPTRAAAIELHDQPRALDLAIRAGAVALSVRAELNTQNPKDDDKRMLATRSGARFFRVPWGDAAPSSRQGAYVTVHDSGLAEATLGDGLVWDEGATVWRQRVHRCGSAEVMDLI